MATRPYLECDTECYPDWWLIKFYLPDGSFFGFERTAERELDRDAVQWFIDRFTLVTFNGDNYDAPMISLAMSGATNHQLKAANDNIIVGGLKRWDFYDAYGVRPPFALDHVDIMEVAPGVRIGLKAYMGRMHAPTIEDLPYSPSEPTTPPMRKHLDVYCGNDLVGTRMLRETCQSRLDLRIDVGNRYDIDLRSKSDAQMAEAIIKSQLGFIPDKRVVPHGYQFQYQVPEFIKFSTPEMQTMLETVRNAWFTVNDIDQIRHGAAPGEELIDTDGKKIKTGVRMPPELKALIDFGGSKYQFGIGGLHSTEAKQIYKTIMGVQTISDHDVKSYYPSLIILLGMFPAQLGARFLEIYIETYKERLSAKDRAVLEKASAAYKSGDKTQHKYWSTIADGLKIVLNGTFGKLFSKYSIMFAPELGIQVTITGQLCLCMLVEMLTQCGIRVISANTDGIVLCTPVGREWLRDACVKRWEKQTGLEMEATFYTAIYSQSVNSYVAFKPDGEVKRKGAFAESGVLAGSAGAHPDKDICAEAVIEYLKSGKPLAQTIRECQDIRKFVSIRAVKGGGVWHPRDADGCMQETPVYLGKTVRYYYAAGVVDPIRYASNGNMVAGSTGAHPAMKLPEVLPSNIDYDRYTADAVKMLGTLGVEHA